RPLDGEPNASLRGGTNMLQQPEGSAEWSPWILSDSPRAHDGARSTLVTVLALAVLCAGSTADPILHSAYGAPSGALGAPGGSHASAMGPLPDAGAMGNLLEASNGADIQRVSIEPRGINPA